MRIRTIKPEFFDSPDTAKASAVLRLAYIGMWLQADDCGRGPCNPKQLEGEIFPHDDLNELSHGDYQTFNDVLIDMCHTFDIRIYRVDGRDYFEIPSWSKHQRVYSKRESRYPSSEEGEPLELERKVGDATTLPGTSRNFPEITGNSSLEQGNRGTGEQGNRGTDLSSLTSFEKKVSTRACASDDPQFTEFWNTYPRKTGKGAARKAWAKATETTDPDVILAAAHAYASSNLPTDKRYIPHPSTWLNQQRWEDEPETKPTNPYFALAAQYAKEDRTWQQEQPSPLLLES